MGAATFGVLASDLREIDAELSRVCPAYPAASEWPLEPSWPDLWKAEGVLGDPINPMEAVADFDPKYIHDGLLGAP
jgi:hypothetical protein